MAYSEGPRWLREDLWPAKVEVGWLHVSQKSTGGLRLSASKNIRTLCGI
jgi:hypothetical protein